MNKNDFQQFSAVWAATCEVVGKVPSSAAIGMVFRSLMSYELDDVRRALDAHMRNPDGGQFAPKPADVIRYIDGDTASRALQAWSKVVAEISSTGSYQTVVLMSRK